MTSGRAAIVADATPHDGGPKKPRKLPRAVSQKWNELMKFIPSDCLRRIDVYQLKSLAEMLALQEVLAANALADPSPRNVQTLNSINDRIYKLSAAFGLTPIDRAKLGGILAGSSAAEDPLAILNQRGSLN